MAPISLAYNLIYSVCSTNVKHSQVLLTYCIGQLQFLKFLRLEMLDSFRRPLM